MSDPFRTPSSDWAAPVGPPGPPPGPYPAPPPRTNGLAITSLVLGILGISSCGPVLGIPAIVLGYKARTAIQASGGAESGEGLALAGRILGWVASTLWVVAVIAMIGFAVLLGTIADDFPGEASRDYLPNGNCFEGPSDISIDLLDTESCYFSHANEIYAAVPLDESVGPERTTVPSEVQQACEDRLGPFTGAGSRALDRYRVDVILAPAGTWTREAYGLCVLSDADGRVLTGTQENAGD